MSAEAEALDAAPLTVCVDFKNPHAWLAVPPTHALEEALGIDADWLPRLVAPLERPPPAGPDDDRGTRHRRLRAEYHARDIERYAAVHGLTIRGLERRPDATLASIGLLFARQAGAAARRRYVEHVFAGHWSQTLDLEDPAALRGALEASGCDPTGFEAYAEDAGRRELDALQATLAERGVIGVPAYLLEGEVFIGRAHLPMVRWILSGREDPPPI